MRVIPNLFKKLSKKIIAGARKTFMILRTRSKYYNGPSRRYAASVGTGMALPQISKYPTVNLIASYSMR